jgi:hypothetical protein
VALALLLFLLLRSKAAAEEAMLEEVHGAEALAKYRADVPWAVLPWLEGSLGDAQDPPQRRAAPAVAGQPRDDFQLSVEASSKGSKAADDPQPEEAKKKSGPTVTLRVSRSGED